jgi:hypothetical protein
VTKNQNFIDPQDLISNYKSYRHPDVTAGYRSADEVQKEFLDSFDVGAVIPGKITRDEFVNYYSNICSSMNNDSLMEIILRHTWDGIDETNFLSDANSNTGNKVDNSVLTRIKDAQLYSARGQYSKNVNKVERPKSANSK